MNRYCSWGFCSSRLLFVWRRGKKGKGRRGSTQDNMPPVTIIQMPTVPSSPTVWKRESKGPPALFCNSFGEESNNLELPGKITDKTLMKNLIPTSTVSSGVLLYYCHFLALLPPLSSLDILSPLLHPTHDCLPLRFHDILRRILVFLFFGKKPCSAHWLSL